MSQLAVAVGGNAGSNRAAACWRRPQVPCTSVAAGELKSWWWSHPLVGVLIGGALATSGSVITTRMVIESDRDAREEDRQVDVYGALVAEATATQLDLTRWREARADGDEAEMDSLRSSLFEHGAELMELTARVRLVGSPDVADVAIRLQAQYLIAAGDPSEDEMVRFVQLGSDLVDAARRDLET